MLDLEVVQELPEVPEIFKAVGFKIDIFLVFIVVASLIVMTVMMMVIMVMMLMMMPGVKYHMNCLDSVKCSMQKEISVTSVCVKQNYVSVRELHHYHLFPYTSYW